ncbi:MAG TPA: hypothetical protein PLT09_13425 [Deltaproteobacteria bacterium]|nr:hypothetical protein [Deltaproteobacteria bacterium]HPR56487.1 hypothetical protein [Deltaproteobacteria bacterium]HXK48443.1 hypothetical protein [Deltaproteobacteria bacterium]
MRSKVLCAGVILMLACLGCGRKLPPLPSTQPDPVVIGDLRFEGPGVKAEVRTNVENATVFLLGKPKGICPHCTDDLVVKDRGTTTKPGEVVLKDLAPTADAMVYRVAVEYGGSRWMTPVRIVVKH